MLNRFSIQILSLILGLLFLTGGLEAGVSQFSNGFLESSASKGEVVIHNRPLARVHGKVISVLDVQKQMDQFLKKAHPQAFNEPEARFQFYVHNWRHVLQEMIDNELMLMEAEELAYKIDTSILREEVEDRFGSLGSKFSESIDALGLSKEEAEKMVEKDLVCRTMMWYRVWQKAMNEVTPQVVEEHYLANIQAKPLQDEWTYQICTIRGKDSDAATKIAGQVRQMLLSNSLAGTSLADAVEATTKFIPTGISVKVSDDIHLTSQQLSSENLAILETLKPMEVSSPIVQKSKYDDQTVMRLFQLKEHLIKSPPSFEEVSAEIRETLVSKKSEQIKNEYMNRLRKHFDCEHLVVEKMYGPQTHVFSFHN